MEEKFEEIEILMNLEANNLIANIHAPHINNAVFQYYARDFRRTEYQYCTRDSQRRYTRTPSVMPHTPFIYEFFIFNALYQIDWKSTRDAGQLILHQRENEDEHENKKGEKTHIKETKMQSELIKYIKDIARKHPELIYRSFEPLLYIKTEGPWTKISVDTRIKYVDMGDNFFKKLNEIKLYMIQCNNPSEMPTSNTKIFDNLSYCIYFIYLVRNNIFHGTKTPGEISIPEQERRIEVYDIFLKCVNSLFFLIFGKEEVASDYIPCPVYCPSPSDNYSRKLMSRDLVFTALQRNMMKTTDPRLIFQFFRQVHAHNVESSTISEHSSLFYPSAGTDFITPILLGLPYCSQFYFFEYREELKREHHRILRDLYSILRSVDGVEFPCEYRDYIRRGEFDTLDFIYEGILRKIHWIHADNMEIFNRGDIDLRFYFHRGDSWTHPLGSGQNWVSEERQLHRLQRLIPANSSALFVIDNGGRPKDFRNEYTSKISECASKMFNINVRFIELPTRPYYCGCLPSLQGM